MRKRIREAFPWILGLSILGISFFLLPPDAFAASELSTDIGLGGNGSAFQDNLAKTFTSMRTVATIISTIMIALAGCMIAFNVESANKTTWNIILGIGLALNFGSLLAGAYNGYLGESGFDTQAPFDYQIRIEQGEDGKVKDNWYDFLQPFTSQYIAYTKSGATAIMPVAAKLLLVLTAISASIKLSMDLISGDKMKFLVQTLLETGLYLFLITNWYGHGIGIMESLANGFEAIGYKAAGQTNIPQGSLITAAVTMFQNGYNACADAFSLTSPISGLVCIVCLLTMLILLVLAGLEMLMAKIEFFTMAMITIPLIPFVALPQTKFLFERALGAMFNLAVKVCVISFLTAMSSKILQDYVTTFKNIAMGEHKAEILQNISLFLQMVVVSLLLFLLIKKIPELVSGLLAGSPSLNGATMTQTAKNITNTGVKAGAAVASGGATLVKEAGAAAMAGGKMGAGLGAGLEAGGGMAGTLAGAALGGIGGVAMGAAGGLAKTAAGGMARGAGMAAQAALPINAAKSGIEMANKLFGKVPSTQAQVKDSIQSLSKLADKM